MPDLLVLATVRGRIADFVVALTVIYSLLILVQVLISMYQSIGGRIPYSRPMRAAIDFVESLTEPLLGRLRRVIPPIGPLDLSPLVALIGVGLVGNLIAALIAG
ncbi:MAG: YggT family protein [Baekduia sp.]